MWNYESQIKSKLKKSGALNADEKWSKSYGNLMLPERVIPPPSSKIVLASAFHIDFTLQQLCKDASDHHSSLTIFHQHLVHYQTAS